jgi:hypothetical protein
MNGRPTLLPGLAQPLIYTSRQIVAGNRPETDPFSVILFRGPGCKELPLISAAALNLKKCASCYGFLREQNQGYRNAAIGFKGSDKPDLPSCGPPYIFFSCRPKGTFSRHQNLQVSVIQKRRTEVSVYFGPGFCAWA